jgi:hypothetical protein
MTSDEINAFRKEFASIVYCRGFVKTQARHLCNLEAFNKGGSHERAILKAVENLKVSKAKLREKLKGKSYDEWKAFSHQLSVMQGRLRVSAQLETKKKYFNAIKELKWL